MTVLVGGKTICEIREGHSPESCFAQLEVAAVVGDANAVNAIQAAHRRQWLACGALSVSNMLLRGATFPRSRTVGDVYIDDFVILAVVHFTKRHDRDDAYLIKFADRMYASGCY